MDSNGITPVMPVGGMSDGFGSFGGGFGGGFYLFALLILFGMMGGGFGAFGAGDRVLPDVATKDFVLNAVDNQTTQAQLQQIALSSANNNYETAQLINAQTRDYMAQNYTNQINVVQGFNAIQSAIAGLSTQLGTCCCEIKTQMLQDKYDEALRELNKAQNEAVNSAQSAYLLSVMGKWIANAPATA